MCHKGGWYHETSAFRVGIQFFMNLLWNMKALSGTLLRVLPASQWRGWLNEKRQCHTRCYIVHSVAQYKYYGYLVIQPSICITKVAPLIQLSQLLHFNSLRESEKSILA